MIDDAPLLRSLGRLNPIEKPEFLREAKAIVARFNAQDAPRRRAPTREDYDALEDVRRNAEVLQRSLNRASRLVLPEQYLHEAWKRRQPGPEFEAYPAFQLLLWKLRESAGWFIDDDTPAHRPDTTWGREGMIVALLVHAYHNRFGRPAAGTGSPFVKFCREFLPAMGMTCPSAGTLAKIVKRNLPAE